MQWSAKLNVSVLEADPYSDHVAAVSQSAAGSDCKYSLRSDGIRPVSEVFFLVSFIYAEVHALWIRNLPAAPPFLTDTYSVCFHA